MRLRWFELRPLLKAVLVTGVAVGGAGFVGAVGLTVQAILAGPATFSLAGSWPYITLFLAVLLLTPFLSALGLLFLPLNEERKDILGFISLISSITALPIVYILLFFLYCTVTHSACS